ncbi:F510_1955 family glycosylhydrolase [Streptomyces sp. TRM49041]|uniref:F510_1955 family glycosylhydrolase n=1 Tax=Streptomyces sp. TRM49041 TaxID=2603216 RepID=UPI0011EDA8B3|nr:exo-alpha-sialidase [Streptomyces sp. TRM49041]
MHSKKTQKKRYAAVAALAALGLALSGCAGDEGGPSPDASGDVEVSHIHGLGVDPADGRVYVATHEGIVTPGADGGAERVGDSHDDYMGFTVIGPKTFVASGHPGHGNEDEPGNRGLIESTDAGKTWKRKSLAGVDFHSLDFAHGTVYGYDSTNGRLRVSENRVDWENRSELRALDIAVSPEDPDTVLATTEDGVARSTDGGRTFAKGTEPVMAFVSWAAPDALFGLDPSGAVHHSADGGRTWHKAATVPGGGPQALTAVTAERVLAATEGGVYESKDAGKTFTQILAASH